MTASVLMIGLDGADAATLEKLSRDGSLPNLARLRAAGATARLSSPPGMTDDAFWASFQYSAGIGEHGRYFYLQRRRDGRFGMAHEAENDRERFWDSLSKAGRRIAIFDVPKCSQPRPLNGVHLADWLVHGQYFGEPRSFPPAYADDIVRRFGPSPDVCCDELGPSADVSRGEALSASLADTADRKLAAGLDCLCSEAWDLFVLCFKEAHCAGHAFTGVRSGHTDDPSEEGEGPLNAILRRIDAAVGELVAAAGEGASVVVFSSMEMTSNTTLEHLVPEIARRTNQKLAEPWSARVVRGLRRRVARRPAGGLCEALPYSEDCTALRINAPPRALGLLPAGRRARDRLADRVAELWGELIDAESGKSVILGIERPSAEEVGARTAALPDLLIRYRKDGAPRVVSSPTLGRFEASPPPIRPGNHGTGGGFCILTGKASAEEVTAVQDLGPLAKRLLAVTAS
ncbi:MAG: alkaline phosphatase family protein [Hyphomonadaceae bacterium]|nr:alkaline phosphatase family protein [Hyphomonadaceae bacterium]